MGVEVRLIENHHHHHNQQQQQHDQQHQQALENSVNTHQHHITLEDSSIISSASSAATAIISNPNQSQQSQNGLTSGVTIQNANNNNLQLSGPTPQQLFRAHIINGSDSSNPLKRRIFHGNSSNSSGTIGNIITSGGIPTIFPIPVSLHQGQPHPSGPPLSTPVTVLTGTNVVGGNASPTSPPTQWVSERQALEREKLQAEVEVLRLQRVKLKLEIEALLQQRQPESCQLLEDYLK